MPKNEAEGYSFNDPTSLEERNGVAHKTCSALKMSMPCIVDQLDDFVNKSYSAWPERIYCIDRDGKIAVMAGPGPFGFAPCLPHTEEWLKSLAPSTTNSNIGSGTRPPSGGGTK